MQSNAQRAGITHEDRDTTIHCHADDCEAWIDTADVGHPENAGWLHRTTGQLGLGGDRQVENYCPECRVEVETEQATLDEVTA